MIEKTFIGGFCVKAGQHISRYLISSILVLLLLAVSFLLPSPAEARRKSLTATKDTRGITFDEFWSKVKEEGTKWAGNRLRVRRIISVPVSGFDGHSGLSAIWEAQIVRCDGARAQNTDEEEPAVKTTCNGRSVTIRVVGNGVKGEDAGTRISKEIHFRGFAMRTDSIALGAARAEETANSHMQYRPAEIDNYTYELKYDQRKGRPIWVIKRTCGYKGRSEGRCRPGDHWIVKVDAESGDIIKQDPAGRRGRVND